MEFPPVRGEFIIKTRSINMKDFYLGLGSFYNLILTFLSLPLEAQGQGPPARVPDNKMTCFLEGIHV